MLYIMYYEANVVRRNMLLYSNYRGQFIQYLHSGGGSTCNRVWSISSPYISVLWSNMGKWNLIISLLNFYMFNTTACGGL